ncbi:unnamed protein product [Chondrus crispus]|uniref:Uncharacterized protein n=1 Tax=Chondrus crispus TaxID=2769 RepID=R7QBV3_CHOCR|nr:unnamed protein product [Chondrus crispus]CDF35529.1 unnamed protein product [Chondrus crispus]|eukprot:XP_005715348.1 unnamed protein product [Chondrus crispus]
MDGVWATHALTGSKGTQALLSLVGRTQQGKVSVGVEIAFQDSPKTHVTEGNASVTAAEVVQINDLPSIDLRTETPDPEAGYSVRRDGPTGMLNELLQELHTGELTPNRVHSRKSRTEVVVVDGDNGPDGEIEAIPSSSKRPRKRRSVSFARSDRKQMEERKAKFVSTVVQTMQEDPAIVKKRQLRAALSPMNGHRTTSRKSEDREARRSTRRRKSVSLVESSDEDASPNDKSEDVPIDIDEDDDGLGVTPDSPDPSPGTRMQVDIQAPLRRMARKARSANTLDSPQPLIRTGTQRTKALDVSGAEPVSKKLRSSTKGNFVSLWDKRLERLEDAIAANETGSPSLSDVEADIEETMLFEIIPTLEKIMDAVRDGEMGLLECDQYSQQNAVIQAYKNTKDDAPYAPTAKSPGTQFYLDVWKDRRARKERKLSVPKIDDGGAQGFATNNPNGGTFANGGTSGEDRSPTASQHTGENSVRSDSSGGKVGEDDAQKAARLEREEASERARELQSRVCGKLLESMSAEAKVRVLRWAEADCSWFDDGTDMMEIVASRVVKTCAQCDERDGNYNEKCEESILLKLWANMTWRKIRRMRHRDRGASN